MLNTITNPRLSVQNQCPKGGHSLRTWESQTRFQKELELDFRQVQTVI